MSVLADPSGGVTPGFEGPLATPFVTELSREGDGARTLGDSDCDGTPVLVDLAAPIAGAVATFAELAGGWPIAEC